MGPAGARYRRCYSVDGVRRGRRRPRTGFQHARSCHISSGAVADVLHGHAILHRSAPQGSPPATARPSVFALGAANGVHGSLVVTTPAEADRGVMKGVAVGQENTAIRTRPTS